MLYVIVPYFSCGHNEQYAANLNICLQALARQKAKVLLVEGVYDGQKLSNVNQEWLHEHLQFQVPHKIWVKENLINLAVQKLPDDWASFVALDCDVLFCNERWFEESRKLLTYCDVIQPWYDYYEINSHGNIKKTLNIERGLYRRSFVSHCLGNEPTKGNSGFAWGFSRKFFTRIGGLFDRHIAGGGDAFLACCAGQKYAETDLVDRGFPAEYVRCIYEDVADYAKRWKGVQVGCTGGSILHLFHGKVINRNYQNRHLFLAEASYQPAVDLQYTDSGILQLSDPGLRLCSGFDLYFKERND